MAIKRQEALTLAEVLGSMLGSVVDAQAQSARATVDFVEAVGFEDTPDGQRLRTVTMRYTKKDENGEFAEFEVEVPLLALVNVPALAVREAKLSFSYDVVTQASESSSSTPATTPATASVVVSKAALLKGFVRSKPTPTTTTTPAARRTTSIDVDVTLEQQELPIGVERLFDLAELGIAERPVDGG